MMRQHFLVVLTLMWVAGCDPKGETSENQGPVKDEFGGGTIGSGVDLGKVEETCYPAFADLELNVATWNIEWFPQEGATSWSKVRTIVEDLQADVIAVQEIANGEQFRLLQDGLPDYEAAYADVTFDQELGFLYKRDAFLSFSKLSLIFQNDSYSFPRQVVRADAVHASGLEIVFLNIHLKCCNSSSNDEDRRRTASEKLKSYIDQNLSNKAVIVLGDFNDEISSTNSPFQNFKNDASNYRFADMSIATGSSSNWSYPSWPSHLDHILITDELFDYLGNVQTVKPESCVSDYYNDVSDHRPVLASFGSD